MRLEIIISTQRMGTFTLILEKSTLYSSYIPDESTIDENSRRLTKDALYDLIEKLSPILENAENTDSEIRLQYTNSCGSSIEKRISKSVFAEIASITAPLLRDPVLEDLPDIL